MNIHELNINELNLAAMTWREIEELDLKSWSLPNEDRIRIQKEIMIFRRTPIRYRESRLPDPKDPRFACWEKIKNGASGLIIGPNGTGKTWFLWACWKELLRSNTHSASIKDATELSDSINHMLIETKMELRALLKDEFGYKTLFIDELDKLRPTDASFQNIKELIGWRYDNGLQTVAVANGMPETADSVTSQYVYSRLTGEAEGNFRAFFGGTDLRRQR